MQKLSLTYCDQHKDYRQLYSAQGIKAQVKELPYPGTAAKMQTSTNCFCHRRKAPGFGARPWTREQKSGKNRSARREQKKPKSRERIFSIKICQKSHRCQWHSCTPAVLKRTCHNQHCSLTLNGNECQQLELPTPLFPFIFQGRLQAKNFWVRKANKRLTYSYTVLPQNFCFDTINFGKNTYCKRPG